MLFALFTLATARVVSLPVTFLLLILLSVGRSMIGPRHVLPTATETIVTATAAAAAGLAVGNQWAEAPGSEACSYPSIGHRSWPETSDSRGLISAHAAARRRELGR